ncbi:MAG: hypothetical protein IJ733_15240 [Lachnospiraceae bacterium]|nr:hypothetical protein [Lachnospiraceae bacterium]
MNRKKLKRILAWIAVVILVGLYITTVVMAILVTPNTVHMFRTSVMATIMVPIMMYVVLFLYRLIHPEDTEDSFEKNKGIEEKYNDMEEK